MRNLVEIFNTNDLRWLLDVDVLPEDYDTEYLIPVLDDILFEYEELTGDKFYTNFLRKSDFAAKDAAKLVVLRGCYTLFICGYKKQALDLLQQMKLKADNLDKVEFEMKRITQQLQVKAMKDAGKEKVKQSFGEMCVLMSKQLGVSIIDVRNYTVIEFVGGRKIIKEMNTK